MSTRCQVIVKDDYDAIWFYRHSDGYPEGTMPSLQKLMDWVNKGLIRDNAEQASGWLVIIGADEYKSRQIPRKAANWEDLTPQRETEWKDKIPSVPKDWKVGAFEPCSPRVPIHC